MDTITFFIVIISLMLVLKVLAKIAEIKQEELIDRKVAEGMQKLKETIIPSKIEVVNNSLFLYNAETNEFIAQGKDFEDLNKNAKVRFPDKLFNVPQDEINKYSGGIK